MILPPPPPPPPPPLPPHPVYGPLKKKLTICCTSAYVLACSFVPRLRLFALSRSRARPLTMITGHRFALPSRAVRPDSLLNSTMRHCTTFSSSSTSSGGTCWVDTRGGGKASIPAATLHQKEAGQSASSCARTRKTNDSRYAARAKITALNGAPPSMKVMVTAVHIVWDVNCCCRGAAARAHTRGVTSYLVGDPTEATGPPAYTLVPPER